MQKYEKNLGYYLNSFRIQKVNFMLANISIDKSFIKARSHIIKEEFTEAQEVYQDVLNRFPENTHELKGLANLKKFIQNDSSFFTYYYGR